MPGKNVKMPPPAPMGGRTHHRRARNRPWSVFGESIKDAPKSKFNMVSMFSGCGGLDLGFYYAGFKILWANDIDADSCETYKNNIGKDIIEHADIRDIYLPQKFEKIDLLAACFPCQSFSNAGSRRGADDENGKLNNYAIKAVNHFKPKIVIYENVRGMLSVWDGEKLLVEKICEKLRRRGYHVYLRILNASMHYVPQNRMRVFIVGIRADAVQGEFGFPEFGNRDGLTLGDTIMDIPRSARNYGDQMPMGPAAQSMCELIPEGGSWKDIDDSDLPERFLKIRRHPEIYRQPNFYRRFAKNEIAGTITASFKPENSGVMHPVNNRSYSVREAARIQSFPDWFEFHGKNTASRCRQVGNAVPPRLSYALGRATVALLKGEAIKEPKSKIKLSRFLSEKRPLRLSDPTIKHEKRRLK